MCHSLKSDKLWHDTEDDYAYYAYYASKDVEITLFKGCRKCQKIPFSLKYAVLHIDTQVLASHVGKKPSYNALNMIA